MDLELSCFYERKELFEDRKWTLYHFGTADAALYGSNMRCHAVVQKEIEMILENGTADHIYIYADKNTILSHYEGYENNGRVHIRDISNIETEIPEEIDAPDFVKGNVTYFYIDLFNTNCREQTINNVKDYVTKRELMEAKVIRTYLCNQYNRPTSCFAKQANCTVLFPMDSTSINLIKKDYAPSGSFPMRKWNRQLKSLQNQKGKGQKKKVKALIGIREYKTIDFVKKTIRLR